MMPNDQSNGKRTYFVISSDTFLAERLSTGLIRSDPGARVLVFCCNAEAYLFLKDHNAPQAVFIETDMLSLTGMDLSGFIRAITPLLILIVRKENARKDWFNINADLILFIPFASEELFAAISVLVDLKSRLDEHRRKG